MTNSGPRGASQQGRSGSGPSRQGPERIAPDDARRVAFDVLHAVHARDAYANLVLPSLLNERRLDRRDAALATELTYATLRAQGTYDAILATCIDRPLDKVDGAVLDVLRLGTHQLLAARIPPHAAVATSVDLARTVVGERVAGFVNAVLRRVSVRDLDSWLERVAPPVEVDPVGHHSVSTSHPRWVVSEFAAALGADDQDELPQLLAANNIAPTVTLVARPGRCEQDELLREGTHAGRWSPYAAILEGGDPQLLPLVRTQRAGVQDEGSQLVALALAAAPLSGTDAAWLDMCAGPGGKAALLAGLADQRGAHLTATEVQPHRARLVESALVGTDATVLVADGRRGPWAPASFDRVLVDAPCTGLGALRRRPEVRWRRHPNDIAELAQLQRELLDAALDATRPGGVVAYATCSPVLAETDEVVEAVLGQRSDVELLDVRPVLADITGVVDAWGSTPTVQMWPHRHGTDAMFVALLSPR